MCSICRNTLIEPTICTRSVLQDEDFKEVRSILQHIKTENLHISFEGLEKSKLKKLVDVIFFSELTDLALWGKVTSPVILKMYLATKLWSWHSIPSTKSNTCENLTAWLPLEIIVQYCVVIGLPYPFQWRFCNKIDFIAAWSCVSFLSEELSTS